MNGRIYSLIFSPTHTSKQIASAVTQGIARENGMEREELDLTFPEGRGMAYAFGPEDILIFAFPVYGGRLPKLLAEELPHISGQEGAAIPIAVYGNRDFDDALIEAGDLLREAGFRVAAAAAFIGEHSFTRKLGTDRPDAQDLAAAALFGGQVAQKLAADKREDIALKGSRPYKDPMPMLPFLPKTHDSCTRCMVCVQGCPMGIIDDEDPAQVRPGCIQCSACVKFCPVDAKYFDAEPLAKSVAMLEGNFLARKEPEIFL